MGVEYTNKPVSSDDFKPDNSKLYAAYNLSSLVKDHGIEHGALLHWAIQQALHHPDEYFESVFTERDYTYISTYIYESCTKTFKV